MGTSFKPGFTIIETLLFLSITGLLIVGVLAGTGTSINTQRYHDSVTTLKSSIQDLYSETTNVRNEDRTTPISCDTNAQTSESTGTTVPRGQSPCVILGTYMTIAATDITTNTVIGFNSSSSSYPSDIDELKAYKMSLLPTSKATSTMEWGTQIAWPVSGSGSRTPSTPRTISILVLRSPTSGLVYTFTSDSIVTDVSSLIIPGVANAGAGQSQRRICVNSSGLGQGGSAVLINAYAATASAVEQRSNDMGDASVC